jgi:hypothetical protein
MMQFFFQFRKGKFIFVYQHLFLYFYAAANLMCPRKAVWVCPALDNYSVLIITNWNAATRDDARKCTL